MLTHLRNKALRLGVLCEEPGNANAAKLIARGKISTGEIEITLTRDAVATYFEIDTDRTDDEALTTSSAFQLRRRGIETKIVSATSLKQPDHKLIEVWGKGHNWLNQIRSGKLIDWVPSEENRGEDCVRGRVELTFLSPKLRSRLLKKPTPPR